MKSNDIWNHFKFQLHWNKLEEVDLEKRNVNNNPLCSYTHKFYIKYGKHICHCFGHSKLKPIDYITFCKRKEYITVIIALLLMQIQRKILH